MPNIPRLAAKQYEAGVLRSGWTEISTAPALVAAGYRWNNKNCVLCIRLTLDTAAKSFAMSLSNDDTAATGTAVLRYKFTDAEDASLNDATSSVPGGGTFQKRFGPWVKDTVTLTPKKTLTAGTHYLYIWTNDSSQTFNWMRIRWCAGTGYDFALSYTEAATYSVTYDANGGIGAPAAQAKIEGIDLPLSPQKPTRANESPGSDTVTLNANGGTVTPASLSAVRTSKFAFRNWNSQRDGTGGSCDPGAVYSVDADMVLYAQWRVTTTTASVTLPTPTRSGYAFLGWATSPDAKAGITGTYTPSGNVTLYAIWKAKGLVRIKHGGEVKKHRPYVRHNGAWRAMIPGIGNGTDWDKPS